MMLGHQFGHDLDGALEAEALAWPYVQFVGNRIQLLLAIYRQVRTLGQVLPDQSIDVFVATALPGAVRVAEVDRHAGLLGDLRMASHLPSLVVGHALARRQRHAIQRRAEPLHSRGRRRIAHLYQHQVAAGALHQGAYRRGVGLALDQVAFPATLAHGSLGMLGGVRTLGIAIAADLATDRRGTAVEHSGNRPLAHAAHQTDLDVGALFNAEFVVRHGNTVPEMSGVALSFCRRPYTRL